MPFCDAAVSKNVIDRRIDTRIVAFSVHSVMMSMMNGKNKKLCISIVNAFMAMKAMT